MIRIISIAALTTLALQHGHCAEPVKDPTFDVASITLCKPGTTLSQAEHDGIGNFVSSGGRFKAACVSVKFLMEWAYGILPAQHSEGPGWFRTDFYEFIAKVEGNPTDDEMKAMTRTLLAERFHLKVHQEKKELNIFVVGVGKTPPKMSPAKEGEVRSIHPTADTRPEQKPGAFHIVATKFSMQQLTDLFGRQLGMVIVNETALNGEWDFAFDLVPDENRPSPMDPSLILTAMREQLGLTVKSQKAMVEFLVIDNVDRAAAAN